MVYDIITNGYKIRTYIYVCLPMYIYNFSYINWCQVRITPYTSAANRAALLLFVRRFPPYPSFITSLNCNTVNSDLPSIRITSCATSSKFLPILPLQWRPTPPYICFFCLFSHLSFRKGKVIALTLFCCSIRRHMPLQYTWCMSPQS